jgi:cation transport regulator ChaB
MPYDTLPERLRALIPAKAGQNIFRRTVNAQLAAGKSEEVAMASAWAALQRAGYDKDESGKWTAKMQPPASQVHVPGAEWDYDDDDDDDEDGMGDKGRGKKPKDYARKVRAIVKRMMNDDAFTIAVEAQVRSMEMGLDGAVHVHETADGQAVYMPGSSHEEYLERVAEIAGLVEPEDSYAEDSSGESRADLLERVISAIMAATMEHTVAKASDILKVDTARRIVWGWASVSTMKGELVTDLQGDRMTPEVMAKMADRFMRSARAAKAMHDGDDVGEVIHSFPLTNELAKAFGIETDREGWITGTYIKSDDEWEKVLRNEYRGLSIGGRARRREVKE